jgi:protein-serine/threonine kinase
MYQQFYGQQQPQQQQGGYQQPQQPFPPQGFPNSQLPQYQQFPQQAQFQQQQQQQFGGGYDANGLAHQLQNQHLSARQPATPGSPQGGQRPRTSGSTQASGSLRDDYVVFNRDDSLFQPSTKERAKALKLKVELHYNQSVAHAVERNQRSGYLVE